MNDLEDHHQIDNLVQAIRPEGQLLRAWPLEGGVSAQVTAIEIAHGDGHIERMVVRRHGVIDKGHNPDIASDEFRLLRVLRDAGLAVSAPIFVDQDSQVFDTPCLVVEYVDGSTGITSNDILEATRQMAHYLSRIHSLDASNGDFSFLPRRDDPAGGIRRHLALLPQTQRADRIRDAVAAYAPMEGANAPVLLHGDFWPGNILWRNAEIAAVLDWEDAAIGDPLADLAAARLELYVGVGHHAMDEFTAHYLSRSKIDLVNLPFWELCAASGMAAYMPEWGLDPDIEANMRRETEAFIDHVLDQVATQRGTTRR